MTDQKKQEPKKGFPGFLILLISAVFLTMLVQQFVSTKVAKVAFNYEVEHLVNLDLIVPTESRKTAGSDQLVTFRGQFREAVSDEGKQRFRYLTLLYENRQLTGQQEDTLERTTGLRRDVQDTATYFSQLTGDHAVGKEYLVFDGSFDNGEKCSRSNITFNSRAF